MTRQELDVKAKECYAKRKNGVSLAQRELAKRLNHKLRAIDAHSAYHELNAIMKG